MSRAYDALYDTVYTVSSATDHYREQARLGGFQVERCPVYENFASVLSHFPSSSFRLKGRDHVPQFVSREYRAPVHDPAQISHISSRDRVSGSNRFKFSQRSLLTSNIPIILVKAARQPALRAPSPDAVAHQKPQPTSCTVGTQSDYREGEAQTDPYSPQYTFPAIPSNKQQLRSARYVSPGVPEISHLSGLKFKLGERPGVHHVAYVNKLRAKRTFEATLPPLDEADLLPVRREMMEQWENKEWQEREDEIESTQESRLALLQDAIVAREQEVEAGHKDRVQKATDNMIAAKQLAFSTIQRDRIKGIRHFTQARKYVDKNRYQTKMSESIIDTYAFPGSSVYAPLQRDGRFPDSRPKGKGIETEHFVPSAMAGIQALEEYLPKRLLETSIKGVEPPKKLDYTKRKEQALRRHLDHISDALSSARAAGQAAGAPAGGLGYGDAWPVPVAGQAQVAEKKASMKKKAVVRNAERPQTPIHEPPPDDDEAHRAATFLQRLLRGRAIQNDMLESAAARDALLTELLQPFRKDLSVGVSVTPEDARVANMVASSIRPLLIALAVDDVEERQSLMAELARQRQAVLDMPDEGAQDKPPSSDVVENSEVDKNDEKAALRIQCGFRGFQARKRVAAMKSEGEQMRQQLLAGATILEVGAVDLSKYEDELNKITKIQATVRGHLERKRLNRRLATTPPAQRQTEGLPDLTAVTTEQEQKVVCVQAGIRGYLARKKMRERRGVQGDAHGTSKSG